MILVDTSVWIDHYRLENRILIDLLNDGLVLSHLFVRGELACGNLKDRAETLRLHGALPQADRVRDGEIFTFIDANDLAGRGLGYVDMNLLASTLLTPETQLWSRDKRLADTAQQLGIAFEPPSYFRINDEGWPVYERAPGDETEITDEMIEAIRNQRGI